MMNGYGKTIDGYEMHQKYKTYKVTCTVKDSTQYIYQKIASSLLWYKFDSLVKTAAAEGSIFIAFLSLADLLTSLSFRTTYVRPFVVRFLDQRQLNKY